MISSSRIPVLVPSFVQGISITLGSTDGTWTVANIVPSLRSISLPSLLSLPLSLAAFRATRSPVLVRFSCTIASMEPSGAAFGLREIRAPMFSVLLRTSGNGLEESIAIGVRTGKITSSK